MVMTLLNTEGLCLGVYSARSDWCLPGCGQHHDAAGAAGAVAMLRCYVGSMLVQFDLLFLFGMWSC